VKKIQKTQLFLVGVMFYGLSTASAQIKVNTRQPEPVHVGNEALNPQQVWENDDQYEHERKYDWSGGRWLAMPHLGYKQTKRRLDHSSRGDRWREGQWHRERRGRGHDNGRHGNNGRH
jgi:hypothetical protein